MNWLKRNWVWLACLAVGAAGLFFFSKDDKSESLEKARAEKERLRQLRALDQQLDQEEALVQSQVDPSQN